MYSEGSKVCGGEPYYMIYFMNNILYILTTRCFYSRRPNLFEPVGTFGILAQDAEGNHKIPASGSRPIHKMALKRDGANQKYQGVGSSITLIVTLQNFRKKLC